MAQRKARKGQTGPAVTLTDVAQEAQVSRITVSRVIRRQGPIAAETLKRVEAAIRKVGYVPNRVAGSLASAGSDLIGVILPSLGNIVFPDVLNGIHDAVAPHGYRAMVSVTEYSLEAEYQAVSALLSWRPAAVMVTGLEHKKETTRLLRHCGVPVVELMDIAGAPIDIAVGMSHQRVGEETAQRLLGAGYRRIGLVGHDLARDLRASKRRESFLQALGDAGNALAGEVIVPGASSVAAGRTGLAQLLTLHPKIEAVYFLNDDMAIGGVFHCMNQGIRLPDQLAIIGFNGLDIGQALPQPLTTVLTRRREIGALAGQCVLDRLAGREVPAITDVGFDFIKGATA
jgi:LacI family gluconate utilization system Gnt-I transcriptional repressor